MRFVVLVADGMGDWPLDELNGRTPLAVARTPHMDWLAQRGAVGLVKTIPDGMEPGSDVANLSILGYDALRYPTARGPFEALAMGLPLEEGVVAYRCNLITTDGQTLVDYSAGHVSSEEAAVLIRLVDEKLGSRRLRFFPGVSYRHSMLWHGGPVDVLTTPPHDVVGQPLVENLPKGDGEAAIGQLIYDSMEILDEHEINRRRRDEGRNPANAIWPWGQGRAPNLPSFALRFGMPGTVIAAVDLIKGIGVAAGLAKIDVPGATGYFDTDFEAKANYAADALARAPFVYLHVEAPDEAGHIADIERKIWSIEQVDEKVIGTLIGRLGEPGVSWGILALADHLTPIAARTHVSDPAPFAVVPAPTGMEGAQAQGLTEEACRESGVFVERGHELLPRILRPGRGSRGG
jgi:2,3-bisphosphoglycerate-independent phosphoglycerate mutase